MCQRTSLMQYLYIYTALTANIYIYLYIGSPAQRLIQNICPLEELTEYIAAARQFLCIYFIHKSINKLTKGHIDLFYRESDLYDFVGFVTKEGQFIIEFWSHNMKLWGYDLVQTNQQKVSVFDEQEQNSTSYKVPDECGLSSHYNGGWDMATMHPITWQPSVCFSESLPQARLTAR